MFFVSVKYGDVVTMYCTLHIYPEFPHWGRVYVFIYVVRDKGGKKKVFFSSSSLPQCPSPNAIQFNQTYDSSKKNCTPPPSHLAQPRTSIRNRNRTLA